MFVCFFSIKHVVCVQYYRLGPHYYRLDEAIATFIETGCDCEAILMSPGNK